jgi:hypothetical protein
MRIGNLTLVNAMLYIAEDGCKWKELENKLHVVSADDKVIVAMLLSGIEAWVYDAQDVLV